ncbi:FecR family protein [Sphingomonas hengshuiensis]|uniref:FecR family protein n=1 Tax=Sphingomonas hengshuiensis TaxID=1609977 RepID=UPI0006986D79|nr:FecR domain-containing protein [Sphingomonas hengshuiensis]
MARGEGGRTDGADHQAAQWFARMQGPDRAAALLAFERWRAADPAHRAAYAEAERQWQTTAGLAGTAMGRARRLPERRLPLWQLPVARAGFALAMVLALLAGLWLHRVPVGQPLPALVAAEDLQASRIGEIRAFKLADGTTVTLDTDSAIDVRFSGEARVVRLTRGRARFDVIHDASRPFLVEAAGRTVTARGTLFDIGFEPGGVRVTLLRGAVDVRGLTPAGGVAAVTRLAPGECFTDVPAHPRVAKASIGAQQWVSGMLDFDAVPLGDVLQQTNRYSAKKVRLGDPALASLRVTGAFRPVPVEQLAASLASAFSLRVERTTQGDFVLKR